MDPREQALPKFCGKKSPEVFYPGEFTHKHPKGKQWKDVHGANPIKVSINRLAHVTHDAEARQIRGKYEFTTHRKVAKEVYVGRHKCNGSFKFSTEYIEMFAGETMFPGFYSWWGIYPGQDYSNEVIEAFKTEGISVRVPDYLKAKPDSRYGIMLSSASYPIS